MRAFFVVLAFFTSTAWASAGAIMVYNKSSDDVIVGNNATQPRSIASITKVMTAMVYLDQHRSLDAKIRLITPVKSNLPRQPYSRRDLLAALLVRSDNAAAETLAADYPGGREAFVRAMNARARTLKMTQTKFVDPSGLSSANVSTAGDVTAMMLASARYPLIREASTARQATFEMHHGQKIRTIELPNTNRGLLIEFDSIVVSKTGYTTAAGWCVGMVVERDQQIFVIVVLGSRSKQARTDQARSLMINHIPDGEIAALDLDWRM
jgi:D-alanyl-D-alanine endopeptidase (penicillin-binding protein 7)